MDIHGRTLLCTVYSEYLTAKFVSPEYFDQQPGQEVSPHDGAEPNVQNVKGQQNATLLPNSVVPQKLSGG